MTTCGISGVPQIDFQFPRIVTVGSALAGVLGHRGLAPWTIALLGKIESSVDQVCHVAFASSLSRVGFALNDVPPHSILLFLEQT